MTDPILKQNVFQRLSAMKSQVINIEPRLDSLRDLGVGSAVVDKDSGINKIRLPFDLAAAQARQNTVRLHQAHTGLGQPNAVAVPERKLAANKIRIVEDRIEPVGPSISRIPIALGKEKRST